MNKNIVLLSLPVIAASAPASLAATPIASASLPSVSAAPRPIRFVVIDPRTRLLVAGAWVRVEPAGRNAAGGGGKSLPAVVTLRTSAGDHGAITPAFDAEGWVARSGMTGADTTAVPRGLPVTKGVAPRTVTLILGTSVVLPANVATVAAPQNGANRPATPTGSGKPPVRDIYIKVTATRVPLRSGTTAAGTTRTNQQLSTFVNRAGNDTGALTRGQSGVASDSNGQQHVRGEHADISFVIDGVPLPDTLSGRQGSVVVASTIQSLDILTGGFPAEFGGQTAAVLDVQTLPGARNPSVDLNLQGGNYNAYNADLTASGPLGLQSSYVINVSDNRSDNAIEPQQPDKQTAHNSGQNQSYFAKFRTAPRLGDAFTLTLSHAPSHLDLSNRTGLGARFANAGQGYGFLGQRNADGTRPDAPGGDTPVPPGGDPLPLASQQDDGQAIYSDEVNEFITASYQHAFSTRDTGELAGVVLHSGQNVRNHSPAINLDALPPDNSIEYNPEAKRDVYHYQVSGYLSVRRGRHRVKGGFLNDEQSGDESYRIIPASQLALNELAALAPNIAPPGTPGDAKDINNNPVFAITPGAASPTLTVHRSGYYRAAYLQDTWQLSKRFAVNYGVRYDAFSQKQNLGQPSVDKSEFSPRLNLSYGLPGATLFRASANHLFNIPPLAQGAVVGQPIQPESLNQYDASVEQHVAPGQTAKVAYYYKEIKNQVDTGLLIPGSQIGLYSAVNFQFGGVHGVELSYEVSPPRGVGLDGYVNYSYSIAKPNGVDNTGAKVSLFNDHDQRHTLGAGLAYLFRGGASAAVTLNYGSGLASSPIPPSSERVPRSEVDLHLTSGKKLFGGRGGFGLDVANLFDSRDVINFQSAFSGTRFQQGRRILGSAFLTF